MCRSSESRILIHWLGINFSFAKTLLSKHCNVLFADLALRPEAQELVSNHASPSQSSARAVFLQTDVRDWQHLERMFQVASKEFGGADIVCPGAGVYEPVHLLTPCRPPPPNTLTNLSALLQLLASTRLFPLNRLPNLPPLRHPRHQPNAPNPCHPARPRPLPLLQKQNPHPRALPQINNPYLQHSRPSHPPRSPNLQCNQTRHQRLRAQSRPPRQTIGRARHGCCARGC